MKLVTRVLSAAAMAAALIAAPALADGDSSSDAAGGFAQSVDQSEGVIIRVPLDAQGAEMTDSAEMALHHGDDLSTSGDLATAFAEGQPAGDQPEVDVDSDSSTSRYRGWNRWRNHGYRYNYYRGYRPTYYYGGGNWNYNYGFHRNYNSYRYYYYRRCW